MIKNEKFCELESKLVPIGYDCYNPDDNSITFVLNKHCVRVAGTAVDSEGSLTLTVEEKSSLDNVKTKTFSDTNVSNIIYIMTCVLENVKELDAKAHEKVDSFDKVLYPVGVGISKAVKDIGDGLKRCGFANLFDWDWYFLKRFDGGLWVTVDEEKRLVGISISVGGKDFLVYRREINVENIKEIWAEIESIIDRFKQAFPADTNVEETVFKGI